MGEKEEKSLGANQTGNFNLTSARVPLSPFDPSLPSPYLKPNPQHRSLNPSSSLETLPRDDG